MSHTQRSVNRGQDTAAHHSKEGDMIALAFLENSDIRSPAMTVDIVGLQRGGVVKWS